jgi:hypothetical protein
MEVEGGEVSLTFSGWGSPPKFRNYLFRKQGSICFDQIFITKPELMRETKEGGVYLQDNRSN